MIDTVNLRDSYKLYKKTVQNPVKPVDYFRITGGLFQFIMQKLWDAHDVELGGGQSLGTIGIRGTKPKLEIDEEGNIIKGGKTDWGNTYKLWKKRPEARAKDERIYFLNEHSNGVTYHYYWWQAGMKIGFKRLYSFKFAKGNKRMLTKLVFEGREWLIKSKKEYNEQANGSKNRGEDSNEFFPISQEEQTPTGRS